MPKLVTLGENEYEPEVFQLDPHWTQIVKDADVSKLTKMLQVVEIPPCGR